MLLFGDFLRDKRQKSGISLRQLAIKLDISPSYLSEIECNKFKAPSSQIILTLGKLLNFNGELVCLKYGRIPDRVELILQQNSLEVLDALNEIAKRDLTNTLDRLKSR
jgi:transcriptional regulator with XRE-family HTH domain